MNGVIGAILPLAIAVTISPLPIIAEVLLLFTTQPVRNAGAYLAGFLLGVGAALSVLSSPSAPSTCQPRSRRAERPSFNWCWGSWR